MKKARNHKTPPSKLKGQSTIEYLLLFAVVILVLFSFLKPGGVFEGRLRNITNSVMSETEGVADQIWSDVF